VSILIGKSVSQILEKCKDPGTFCVPCILGNNKFENAMLDLGTSINVMPLSIFKSISLGPLQPTSVVIQLANRSVAHPVGLIDDVLVRVGELIFPTDFYILDMEEGFSHDSAPIILGRPFLKTARTKIDVHAGTLSMEFDDIVMRFNILDAMKHPFEDHSVFHVDIIDDTVDGLISDFHSLHALKHSSVFELSKFACIGGFNCDLYSDSDFDVDYDSLVLYHMILMLYNQIALTMLQEVHMHLIVMLRYRLRNPPISPSPPVLDIQPASSTPELKPLPDNLKYVYLEKEDKLPVIISTSLTADIPGISPSTCMHRILLEDGAKPMRQPQM